MEHFLLIGNNFFNRNHLHPNDSTCKISACISFPCRSTHSQTLCKLEKTILHLQALTVESRSKTLNSENMVKPPKNKLGTDHVSTRAPSLSILSGICLRIVSCHHPGSSQDHKSCRAHQILQRDGRTRAQRSKTQSFEYRNSENQIVEGGRTTGAGHSSAGSSLSNC